MVITFSKDCDFIAYYKHMQCVFYCYFEALCLALEYLMLCGALSFVKCDTDGFHFGRQTNCYDIEILPGSYYAWISSLCNVSTLRFGCWLISMHCNNSKQTTKCRFAINVSFAFSCVLHDHWSLLTLMLFFKYLSAPELWQCCIDEAMIILDTKIGSLRLQPSGNVNECHFQLEVTLWYSIWGVHCVVGKCPTLRHVLFVPVWIPLHIAKYRWSGFKWHSNMNDWNFVPVNFFL
jgi:hypothetical protein